MQYYNSGTLTNDAGQAAGTLVVAQLANNRVLNATGTLSGSSRDTSLSFTSTALTSEQYKDPKFFEQFDYCDGSARLTGITNEFTNGQYCVDYRHGTIYGVKASTQSTLTSAAYKVGQQNASVSPILGQAGIAGGEGTVGSTTTRVVYALQPKTFTDSTVSVTGSSGTVLASNANRKVGTSISNAAGTGVLYLNTTDAAVVGQGWAVQPGQTFTMSENEFTTAAITGISSSGTITASVMEAT